MYTTSNTESFSFTKRLRSFSFAFKGIIAFFEEEHNAWVHLFTSFIVVLLALIIPCSSTEIIMLVFAMGFVWAAEIFNTAIERIADQISLEQNPQIKFIKDLSAAGVLIAALSALIIGSVIFIPKIF
jgi:diacylglycerol kinase (ATP)